jgi:preprotein translocase subunit SecD
MRTRSAARVVGLGTAAALLAGCGSASGISAVSGSPTPTLTLELRLVDSSTDGPCSEPPLTSGAPGSACGESGTTTYQVGASLGEVTPTAVTYTGGLSARQVFRMEFDDAGRVTLADVTRSAVGKELAILVEGKVLSAAHVIDPITGGQFELTTTTPAETEKAAAALHASATS